MLAIEGTEPFDDPGWLFEPKWDGYRALLVREGGKTRLYGRSAELTERFPELKALSPGEDLVLDGEVVGFKDGRQDLGALSESGHTLAYVAFDLLRLGEEPLLSRPLKIRRELLVEQVRPAARLFVSPSLVGEGRRMFLWTAVHGFEGMMAKDLSSPYLPGVRSRAWLKFVHRSLWEVEIGEVRLSHGVLVAEVHEGGRRRGRVVLGRPSIDRRLLEDRRVVRERDVLRIDPPLRARVAARGITRDGYLRHPSFQGFLDER